jgi:hypothetical protein
MTSTAVVPTTRLRLTTRGRRFLVALIALPLAGILAFGAINGGAAVASRDDGAPSGAFTEVTVMAGQSLWSIAQEVAPSADPRDVVAAIARLNAIDPASLAAGQRLAIPAEYAS